MHCADGYARASGRLGVALTSTGPGAANAMGALHEAHHASSRVLMITGQSETRWLGKGRSTIHEADRQLDMLRTVTRRVRLASSIAPTSIATVVAVARDVLQRAAPAGRGRDPDRPAVRDRRARGRSSCASRSCRRPDAGADRRVPPTCWRRPTRPLIWAGGGVVSSGRERLAGAARRAARRTGAHVGRGPRCDPRGPPAGARRQRRPRRVSTR